MTKPPSKQKIKNFRIRIKEINDQELELRAQLKQLYEQFTLDVGDSEMALRHVRQAFFQIQKFRIRQQLEERMEFHPFFGSNPLSSHDLQQFDEELDDDDDDII